MWVGVGAGVGVGVGVDFSKPESESELESLKFGRPRTLLSSNCIYFAK